MRDKPNMLTKATMTDDQRACFDLLCKVFLGEHHAPNRIYSWGRGIKCHTEGQRFSTFDFDYLTRLVVLAHDACVRVEIVSSGPAHRLGAAQAACTRWRHARAAPDDGRSHRARAALAVAGRVRHNDALEGKAQTRAWQAS